MSDNKTNRKINMNPNAMTFITEEDNVKPEVGASSTIGSEQSNNNNNDSSMNEDKRLRELNRINKLKAEAKHLYLPNDPAYVKITDDLLQVNEMSTRLDASTRVMINVALGDYCIFRKKPVSEDEDEEPENVKLLFRRVYYEDFEQYQDVQEELNDINRRITRLENTNGDGTEAGLDRLAQLKKDAKLVINRKIATGLKVFFKNAKEIIENMKKYDYNDELFNIEIGVFRYTRAPFLQQISSTNTS